MRRVHLRIVSHAQHYPVLSAKKHMIHKMNTFKLSTLPPQFHDLPSHLDVIFIILLFRPDL